MAADLTWLVRARLVEIAQRDYVWSFIFAGGGCVVTSSAWRLITPSGIEVGAEDHGAVFGREAPVDAVARVLAATKGKEIREVRVVERTTDLVLKFEEGVTLEFLNLSCALESWRARFGQREVICIGGGGLG